MSHSGLFSESAKRVSLWISAIAGSALLATSPVMSSSAEAQSVQFGGRPTSNVTTVNRYMVMAIALGGAVGLSLGLNAVLDRRPSAHGSLARLNYGNAGFDRANRSLQRRLLLLLHDDRGAANRLFTQANFKYPGKSPDWYVEKIIYDLERDRGKV